MRGRLRIREMRHAGWRIPLRSIRHSRAAGTWRIEIGNGPACLTDLSSANSQDDNINFLGEERMAKRLIKSSLLLGAACGGMIMATPAFAQSSSDDSATGDIIVTARRSEERLQDVPISITVFNQEQISNRNVVTATDLATYTPSLTVNQRFGPEKSSYSIRGFVQENSTAPSVGVYFADVVAGRAQGGTTSGGNAPVGSFMDLQNVQVLKGPQGTLFGRNTTGGAVLLVPNKPTDRLEGWIEASAGDYSMW